MVGHFGMFRYLLFPIIFACERMRLYNPAMRDFEIIRRRLDDRLLPPDKVSIEIERIPQAAVTVILHEESGIARLMIIKRADREGDPWSGHLALPGGRAHPEDSDLIATAARETREEVGMNLFDGGQFIGRLPVLNPSTPRLPPIEILPLVAIAPPEFSLILNHEVASAFWMGVDYLKQQGLSSHYSMNFGPYTKKWPAYPSDEGPIWGITERILSNFLSLID